MASLQGDSQGFLEFLRAFASLGTSVGIIEGTAIGLFGLGLYVSWGISRRFFSDTFAWMSDYASRLVAGSLVTIYGAFVFIGYTAESTGFNFFSNLSGSVVLFSLVLLLFVIVLIPSVPPGYQAQKNGLPLLSTFAAIVVVSMLALFMYAFVSFLPITISF